MRAAKGMQPLEVPGVPRPGRSGPAPWSPWCITRRPRRGPAISLDWHPHLGTLLLCRDIHRPRALDLRDGQHVDKLILARTQAELLAVFHH